MALGALFPDKLTLALEIRPKVTEYVRLRIEALRAEHPGQVGALRLAVAAVVVVAPTDRTGRSAVPERVGDAHQRDAVSAALLPQGAALKALLLLPGPTVQAAQLPPPHCQVRCLRWVEGL